MDIVQAFSLVFLPIPLGASMHPKIARLVAMPPGAAVFLTATGTSCLIGVLGYSFGSISIPVTIVICSPLYQVLFIGFSYRRFIAKQGREPVDVIFNFKSGLKPDRALVMGYGLLGLMVPLSIYGWSIWGSASANV